MELGSPVDRQCDQAEDLFAAMPVYDEEEDDDPIAAGYERFPPNCAVCKESLVMWGGPVSLSCGHSLCLECLRKAQTFSSHPLLCPLCKEIEEWVPVSVPPMDIDDYEKGLYENGCDRVSVSPDKKLGALFTTMRKMVAGRRSEAKKSRRKQSLYAMTSFLEDVQVMKAVFEAEPPEWLPDSSATSCMQCSTSFKALSCGRHHCRFCGQIFCGRCSSARSLLPSKFRVREPQRVCDTCASALEPGQTLLALQVSHAFQTATHDVTDASCLRSWLNSPLGLSMEHEIYKATNTLRHFLKAGRLAPERTIPATVLKNAKGLAILTVVKAGMGVTYKVGTGLLVARLQNNTWSAPSAIASCGMGWGLQFGGELTDFIIVLRNDSTVKAFGGRVHLSIGAGVSVAAGPVGRVAEADLRTGDGGVAACYTYSCSRGVFLGCSLEGNVVATRKAMNSAFYGDNCVTAKDILFGSVPQPNAASPLYDTLEELCR
ncbi:uncharacterized protein LOC9648677 isoform X1 [Selaginella moellendorffii]|nr:uncharacterized protein LOC9648677 isoform X1 [Selaginella moellendorffii]|eukprot:XP_002976353.2 uncharacterized protein LOC9648677 isoform X1 [Selaginella moellendorffii]